MIDETEPVQQRNPAKLVPSALTAFLFLFPVPTQKISIARAAADTTNGNNDNNNNNNNNNNNDDDDDDDDNDDNNNKLFHLHVYTAVLLKIVVNAMFSTVYVRNYLNF